jgi:hypothetical protein
MKKMKRGRKRERERESERERERERQRERERDREKKKCVSRIRKKTFYLQYIIGLHILKKNKNMLEPLNQPIKTRIIIKKYQN